MMKYELKIEADNVDELLDLFANLKDRPINELPKASKVTVEIGDDVEPEEAAKPKKKRTKKEEPAAPEIVEDAESEPTEDAESEPTEDAESVPVVTLIDVQRKFKSKASGGNKAHLREILQHYGAGRVSDLDPKDYAAVMQELDLVEA